MFKNAVKLEIFIEEGMLESRLIDIHTWYDGTCEEIDSSTYRESNKITKIKGIQYNNDGNIIEYG